VDSGARRTRFEMRTDVALHVGPKLPSLKLRQMISCLPTIHPVTYLA